jgi:hypothetical protein
MSLDELLKKARAAQGIEKQSFNVPTLSTNSKSLDSLLTNAKKGIGGVQDVARPTVVPQPKEPLKGLFSIRSFGDAFEYTKNAFTGLTDFSKQDIPVAGGITQGVDMGATYFANKRLEKGEADEQDVFLLKQYLKNQEIESEKYGKAGYGLGAGIKTSLVMMSEIGLGLGLAALTGGSSAAGSVASIAGKKAASQVSKKVLSEKIKENLTRAGMAAAVTSYHIPANTFEKMIGDYRFDENDMFIIDKPGDSLPSALSKAVIEHGIEYGGEMLFGEALGALGDGARSKLFKAGWLKTAKELNPNVPPTVVAKIVDKMGWNGIWKEMGEEEMQNIANGVMAQFGLSDQDYKLPTAEELAERLLTFGAIQTGISTANKVVSKQAIDNVSKMSEKEKTEYADEIINNSVKVRLEAGQNPADLVIDLVQQTEMSSKDAKEIVDYALRQKLAEVDMVEMTKKVEEVSKKTSVELPAAENVDLDTMFAEATSVEKADTDTETPAKKVEDKTLPEDLVQEAKKYKSAEEFVNAQGKPIYRGQEKSGSNLQENIGGGMSELEGGKFFAVDKNLANKFGDNTVERIANQKNTVTKQETIKLQDMATKQIEKDMAIQIESDPVLEGMALGKPKAFAEYTGKPIVEVQHLLGRQGGEVVYYEQFDNGILRTKSQLTDIWNKANTDSKESTTPAKPSYQEWVKSNPEAVKEAKELSEKAKTIKSPKDRAKFLKDNKSKFDSKYSNKFASLDKESKEYTKKGERTITKRLIKSPNEALRNAFIEEAKNENLSTYDVATFLEQDRILSNILEKPNAGQILIEVLEGGGSKIHESGLTIGTAIKAINNNVYKGAFTPRLSKALQYAAMEATTLGQQVAHFRGIFEDTLSSKQKDLTQRKQIVYARRKGLGKNKKAFDKMVKKKVEAIKKEIKEKKARKKMNKDAWADLIKDLSC